MHFWLLEPRGFLFSIFFPCDFGSWKLLALEKSQIWQHLKAPGLRFHVSKAQGEPALSIPEQREGCAAVGHVHSREIRETEPGCGCNHGVSVLRGCR